MPPKKRSGTKCHHCGATQSAGQAKANDARRHAGAPGAVHPRQSSKIPIPSGKGKHVMQEHYGVVGMYSRIPAPTTRAGVGRKTYGG